MVGVCLYFSFVFLMIRLPPKTTRTYTLFPFTTLVRSVWESMLDRRTRWPTPFSPFRKSSRSVLRPSKHGDDCFVAFEPVRGIRVHRVWTRRTEARQRITTAPCRRRQLRSEEHTSELQSLMRISYAVFCFTKKTSL